MIPLLFALLLLVHHVTAFLTTPLRSSHRPLPSTTSPWALQAKSKGGGGKASELQKVTTTLSSLDWMVEEYEYREMVVTSHGSRAVCCKVGPITSSQWQRSLIDDHGEWMAGAREV